MPIVTTHAEVKYNYSGKTLKYRDLHHREGKVRNMPCHCNSKKKYKKCCGK